MKIISDLSKLGSTVIFGGAIRDILLCNYLTSDIDVVVDFDDNVLKNYIVTNYRNYKINKFGGYRVIDEKYEYDIWSLKTTYVYKNNLLPFNNNINDLIYTTFFDWDSVVFNVNENNCITIPNYINILYSKNIKINHVGTFEHVVKALSGIKKFAKYVNDVIKCCYEHDDKRFEIVIRNSNEFYDLYYLNEHHRNLTITGIQKILLQ